MNRRGTIVGLCMLCALAFSAVAAQGAGAATKGTTAFTCKETGAGGTFTKAHCKPGDAGSGNFSHVAIAENTPTAVTFGNAKTNAETTGAEPTKLKATVAGIETELQATTLAGSGTIENKKDASGEHFVTGMATLEYKGVTVTKPAGKGCKVFKEEGSKGEGEFASHTLTLTTLAQGDFWQFHATLTVPIFTFWITCTTKVEALEGKWEISGTFNCPTEGATIVCTHAATTAANTLKKNGVKAGIEGKMTFSGTSPISVTTVETP